MVTQAENETLVRVGPGTDMGEYMRSYLHPVATSAQLPQPDCKPLRIKLLGQKLVVLRNSGGEVGVLNDLCMNRGVSLKTGGAEEGGIRCLHPGRHFDERQRVGWGRKVLVQRDVVDG